MQKKKTQQQQQCFLKDDYQIMEARYLQAEIDFNLQTNIRNYLPPNQLTTVKRPDNLFPRTFSNNRDIFLLPQQLNQKSVQSVHKSYVSGINRIKIGNKQKLEIQQYFKKKDFICIYNRLSKCKQAQNTFMGQIKYIQSNSDYNHKMYKQLQHQIHFDKQIEVAKLKYPDQIDADFESGNICKAYILKSNNFDNYLIIQNDINTHGYNNWFFFRYRNSKIGPRTFNIVNFIKKTQNYKKGMRISIFSRKKHFLQKVGWQKGGNKISFGQTNFKRMFHNKQNYFYLSFEYQFEYQDDQVYFSLNQPYTYSKMVKHISTLQQFKTNSNITIQQKTVGYSIANNLIPMLKIKSNIKSQQIRQKTILITARQHPCQTVGSYLCQSLIDFLISNSLEAKKLLQNFQFIIIPMVNPDGVIHGSSRCNLAGFDLNRQWDDFLIKQLTPQTYRLKKIINQIHTINPIKYVFDLHGHGKKFNSFLFSCKKQQKMTNRILELSLNKLQPRFNIFDCTYGIEKDKQSTIRSQLYQLGIEHVYTLQNSLFGFSANGQINHYNENDFKSIAKSLIKSILIMDSNSKEVQQILGFSRESLEQNISLIQKITQKQQQNKKNIFDNASDSDPDGDILNIQERIQTYKDNRLLQKKIREQMRVKKIRHKIKNQKKCKKQQQKQVNLTGSCPNADTFNDASSSQQKKVNQSLSQRNKEIGKIVLKNKKNIIYNHRKIRQKRQSLNSTKVKLNQKGKQFGKFLTDQNQILHKTQLKLSINKIPQQGLRKKMCSSVIYQYPSAEVIKDSKRHSLRTRTQYSKDESKESQLFFIQDKKLQVQAKFCELKQQSLKSLLNDTFSILKLQSKFSIKGSRQIRMQTNKNIRSNSQKKKLNVLNRANFSQRIVTQIGKQFSKTKQSFKYKRFQSFVQQTGQSMKNIEQKNSVFYYFPVL